MKKKIKHIFTIMTVFVLLLAGAAPVLAEDLPSKDEAEAMYESLQQKYEEIDNSYKSLSETQTTLDELSTQIESYNATIAQIEANTADTRAKIETLQQQQAEQEAQLEERLRVLYMYGNDGYVQILFSSENLTDLLTRVDSMRDVMVADRENVTNIENTKNEISDSIATEMQQLQEAEDAKTAQETLQKAQEELKTKQQAMIDENTASAEAEKADYNAIASSLGLPLFNGVAGGFLWPFDMTLARAFYISSPFGYRSSPGGIGSTYHEGIDITPGAGTPIMAVADGLVTKAENYSGYGNCVVIDNGTNESGVPISTLYGHMQSYVVSEGQTVTQGQVIGYVGSTGNSTGAHLHLTVYENGTAVDPMSYYPDLQSKMVYVD